MSIQSKNEDVLLRGLALGGTVRVIAVTTTELVRELCERHDAGPLGAVALGRVATATALLSATLKDRQKVGIQVNGDGPLGEMYVLADAEGALRGTIVNPRAELPLKADGALPVADGVGMGRMTVIRRLNENESAYRGVVPLVSGEIGGDLAEYLMSSEQIPSAVVVGEKLSVDGVVASGGIMVQALPDADPKDLDRLVSRIRSLPPIGELVTMVTDVEGLCDRLIDDLEVMDRRPVKHVCPCSREHFARKMVSLGEVELKKLTLEEEEVKVQCQFCRVEHVFDREQLNALLYGARLYFSEGDEE